MSDKNRGTDHLLNHGPVGAAKSTSARYSRRMAASKKYAGKTDMGRDELFRQRLGLVAKGRRFIVEDGEQQ
ncbi:hypothetical protein PQC61_gp21 [Gordonia phage Emperor]|uniref:Uncharacterized protein n=2 Tax=root TaxID=1 RepID=A0A2Z4Q402_9CAUD|nr:hypothetical protein [Gordonia westfalica]YP_010674618.1 hypothetical protein PQC61_gp21 [Gordonia phage Emperor]AWY04767.1 hypothetical protein PBI_EMPEROR_21 [Gordonia phage Emperor]SDU50643.1 hypothetical protein SAMN04488548_1341668 [Gordonia westfalica]